MDNFIHKAEKTYLDRKYYCQKELFCKIYIFLLTFTLFYYKIILNSVIMGFANVSFLHTFRLFNQTLLGAVIYRYYFLLFAYPF